MTSFFRPLFSPFKKVSSDNSFDLPRRSSQTGPFSTGASIEAQTPPRRRRFWVRDSVKWSGSAAPDTLKNGKQERAEKMGTVYGVFIPTTLNVLSILMYLRVSLYKLFYLTLSTVSFLDKVGLWECLLCLLYPMQSIY
jgi:hypothetical protein